MKAAKLCAEPVPDLSQQPAAPEPTEAEMALPETGNEWVQENPCVVNKTR